jgi:hypothetical protein
MDDREAVINLVIKELAKIITDPSLGAEQSMLEAFRSVCDTRVTNFDKHFKDGESAIKAACKYIMTHNDVIYDEAVIVYNAVYEDNSRNLDTFRNAEDFESWLAKLAQAHILLQESP